MIRCICLIAVYFNRYQLNKENAIAILCLISQLLNYVAVGETGFGCSSSCIMNSVFFFLILSFVPLYRK